MAADNFKKNAIILWNHDKNKPIGRALAVEARDEGLYVKARISASADPEISRIRDLIQEGVLNAFSVGFDASEEAKSVDGYNEIRGAELFEISVVSLPMNQDSLFTTTKAHTLDAVTTKARELAAGMLTTDDTHGALAEAPQGSRRVEKAAQEEAETAEGDAVDAADQDPAEGEEKADGEALELEWQALSLPKEAFADGEAVAAYLAKLGLDEAGELSDGGQSWLVTLEPKDNFLSLSSLNLPGGVTALVGVCKPAEDAAEDAAEGETEEPAEDAPEGKSATLEGESKEMPTAPLPEAPQVDLPEDLLQARQTNILLSQIVAEFQSLRSALLDLAAAQPPKAAPVPVPDAAPEAALAPKGLETAETALFDEYRSLMADISRRIDRLQA